MKPLRAPTRKPILLGAVRPNAGIAATYRKRLDAEILKMRDDVLRAVRLVYDDDPPATIAEDASPTAALRAMMRALLRRWNRRFATLADDVGKRFAKAAIGHGQKAMLAELKKSGFAVDFTMTDAASQCFAATLDEQVNLIKSLPAKALTQVATLVNQSVQVGGDIGGLAKAIEGEFGTTRRRAATIARDQNNKATATITMVRQRELGITKARWIHSHGGKAPRPEHVAFSKGTHRGANPGPFYDVTKGAYLEGKWTYPGHEINCRCVSVSVIPGLEDDA